MEQDQKIIDELKQIVKDRPLSYFNYIMSSKRPQLRDYVLEHSSFLDGKLDSKHNKPYSKATRIIYAIYGFQTFPQCCVCGKDIMRNLTCYDKISNLHCSNSCAQKDPDIIAKVKNSKYLHFGDPHFNNIAKSKQTCKDRYGVDFYYQSDDFKEKSKASLIEHYGVEHQMKCDNIKNGIRQRYKEKHGVEHQFQNPEVKKKINETFQEKYGVDWIVQHPEMRAIMHERSTKTQNTNYFNGVISKNKDVIPLFSLDDWLNYEEKCFNRNLKWQCKTCGHIFEGRILNCKQYFVRCYNCHPVLNDTSLFEKEIADFVSSLGEFEVINHTSENRKIIPPKEIDIIVKKDGNPVLFIEADGLFWHCTANNTDKHYHVDKTNRCEELGIQLLHIFDDELYQYIDIVKANIKRSLGIYDIKIDSQKCHIKEITDDIAKEFLVDNCLTKVAIANLNLGCFCENELVSIMSFKAYDNNIWHIANFCNKLNYSVDASVLLKYFEDNMKPSKIFWAINRRWENGKLQNALGFDFVENTPPKCWNVDEWHGYHFEFDDNDSQKYDIIWDSGYSIFSKTIDFKYGQKKEKSN